MGKEKLKGGIWEYKEKMKVRNREERKRKYKGIMVEKRIEGEMEVIGYRGKRKRKGVLGLEEKKFVL